MLVYSGLRSLVGKENSPSNTARLLRMWKCNDVSGPYLTREHLTGQMSNDRVSQYHWEPLNFFCNIPIGWTCNPHSSVKFAKTCDFPTLENCITNVASDLASRNTGVLRFLVNQRADTQAHNASGSGSTLGLLTPRWGGFGGGSRQLCWG